MTQAAPAQPRTAYRVRAQSVEACSCAQGRNCQFGGTPNEGKCEFVIGYVVDEGRYGEVNLRGFRAVVVAKYPNAIHEGHGHVALFVDERARPEQVEAFATILSGHAGGSHTALPPGLRPQNVVSSPSSRSIPDMGL